MPRLSSLLHVKQARVQLGVLQGDSSKGLRYLQQQQQHGKARHDASVVPQCALLLLTMDCALSLFQATLALFCWHMLQVVVGTGTNLWCMWRKPA